MRGLGYIYLYKTAENTLYMEFIVRFNFSEFHEPS